MFIGIHRIPTMYFVYYFCVERNRTGTFVTTIYAPTYAPTIDRHS